MYIIPDNGMGVINITKDHNEIDENNKRIMLALKNQNVHRKAKFIIYRI